MEDGHFGTGQLGWKEIVVAAIAVVSTALVLSWISRLFRSRGYRLPPGPKGWPLLGAIPYVGEFPHKSFSKLSKKYGPVMYMHLGAMPLVVISNTEMVKEMYRTQDQQFASRPPLLISNFISYGFQSLSFVPYGLQWRQTRKVVSFHLLTPARLSHFMGLLWDEVLSTVHFALEQSPSESRNDVKVNLSNMFNGMVMNMITQMMWKRRHRNFKGGQRDDDQKFEMLITDVMHLFALSNIADFLPRCLQSFSMKLSGLDKRVRHLHTELDEFCEGILCEREEALLEGSTSAADDSGDDFVDVMLKLMSQPGESGGLSRDATKAILTDMLLAGTDTASVTLDWIFSELMRHPEMMKKVQNELAEVVGEHRLVSETDIPNLTYLNAVVKETLRFHTPAPFVFRYAREACKVGGYDVPVNTAIFVSAFDIHHDPAFWEDPLKFNPDRFLQSEVDYKGRNFELLPFGSGRRVCPGLNFATNVIHRAAAQLLHTITWSLPEGQKPEDFDMSERLGIVIARANPLSLIARPRLAHDVIYPVTA